MSSELKKQAKIEEIIENDDNLLPQNNIEKKEKNNNIKNNEMPMLALRGLVVFPGMIVNFDVGREKSMLAIEQAMKDNQQIFLTAQMDISVDDPELKDMHKTGVVAEIRQILKLPNNNQKVLIEGLYRAKIDNLTQFEPYLIAEVSKYPIKKTAKKDVNKVEALVRSCKKSFEDYCLLSPKMPKEIIVKIMSNDDPVSLGEFICGNLMLPVGAKQAVLEESDYIKRLDLLLEILQDEINILAIEKEISERVKSQIDENQREYYLREQIKAISSELGEDDDNENDALFYKYKIMNMGFLEKYEEKLLKEANRLQRLPSGSHEAGVIRNYLDTCLSLPWDKSTKEKLDIIKAEKVLNREHYGMIKVKERILEFLAVKMMAPDIKGQIICLEGPPGVGKTSIAKSLAKAMGRKYVRISLGGVKDEAEIRGHRKTYIGAMPGRIIDALKTVKVKNPLILLDEIDKMSNDFKGDPSSAMLEVLDGEQNSSFRDHYIELPFDLSEVMFITTANDISSIPAPLLDRMEIINLASYTREEKFNIAKKHLVPKMLKKHGLGAKLIKISDDAIYDIIDFYTREAGVRTLERQIATICRKTAMKIVSSQSENDGSVKKIVIKSDNLNEFLGNKKYKRDILIKQDKIGVVTGLAWTSVGGETLEIEVQSFAGDGKIQLTGSLGDVMQESAKTAISIVRAIAPQYGIDADFFKKVDLHIHAPEGAVPKDGPSAGVTMVTAIVSELAQIPVRHDVAMTGEVSLKGRVMAIGGLKEKSMAAYRLGIKTVIIPAENEPDLDEIDNVVKKNINFIVADHISTVLETALNYPEIKVDIKKKEIDSIVEINDRKSQKSDYVRQ